MKFFKYLNRLLVITLSLIILVFPTPLFAERSLSLTQAIQLAIQNNPELRLEEAKVNEAELRQKSTRGLYGPRLAVEGNVLVWDSALAFKLGGMPPLESFTQDEQNIVNKYGDLFQILPKIFDFGNLRDQVTAQFQVSLAQPLTPLLQIHQGYQATKNLTEAAAWDSLGKRVEVLGSVKDNYLRLMQAQRFVEVAQTGVEQVSQHVKRAQQFNMAGLIGKQEVLKAQVELARAKERLINAKYGVSLASSALALQIGLPGESRIVPNEKVTDPPPPLPQALSNWIQKALNNRSELKSITNKQQAAVADHKRSQWDMIPQISAVATYQHTQGQGVFSPPHAAFAGGVLKWDVWDWGNKYYAARTAAAKVQQAEMGKRILHDAIMIQTKQAYLELRQSEEALIVARAAIKEAEENFRIEQRRFEANANTTTDVLDAQLALTRAQLSYTTALYGYYIARNGLHRAIGDITLQGL